MAVKTKFVERELITEHITSLDVDIIVLPTNTAVSR